MTEPDQVNIVAMEIQQPSPLEVFNAGLLATLQNTQAKSGKRLMEKTLRIFIQPATCFGVEMFCRLRF